MLGTIIGDKYQITRVLGSGSFSELYIGANLQSSEEVAIKVESVNARCPQLMNEARILKLLQPGAGLPSPYWFGSEGEFNYLAMSLLGPSLEDLFNFCHRKFSLKTVLMLADQMISRLEYLHTKHLIHRDVKPANFLIGHAKRTSLIHLIDFGLTKQFRDPKNFRHIPFQEGKKLTGTARFVSINTHMGFESSRRDDLESLAYLLVYLLQGGLPWQGIEGNSKEEKYANIMDKKVNTSVQELCSSLPNEFAVFLNYCRSLQFEQKPDYAYLRRILKELFLAESFEMDFVFDWTLLNYHNAKPSLRKIEETPPPKKKGKCALF